MGTLKSMYLPKISIVTPSFNQGQYIEETILSIINQNYPKLEYIIIDGGSTDNTIEIIKKYEKYITYWVSEKDKGQSDAINKGLAKCTGEIFNWINSDDYLAEGALLKIAQHFIQHPDTEMLCGWCNFIDTPEPEKKFRHRTELFETVEETLVQQRINQPASFYRLPVIKQLGGINTALHYAMDLDLWFRYLLQFGQQHILLVEDLLAHFRLHHESKTTQLTTKFREEEKTLMHHLTGILQIPASLSDFFASNKTYAVVTKWECSKVNKDNLVNSICKKYFFDFYRQKKYAASRFAFLNQLKAGNLSLQRNYLGMFYHLFIRRLEDTNQVSF